MLIDARGLECPKPVILARKALDQLGSGTVKVMVDNSAARDNVLLMAQSAGCSHNVRSTDYGYEIEITKLGGEVAEQAATNGPDTGHGCQAVSGPGPLVVVVSSDRLGQGEEELGQVLMRSFFVALSEGPAPDTVIFLNAGVKLSAEGSPVLEQLKALESVGVEILSCGTCLNYYHLTDHLVAGKISNMYTIVERLAGAYRTITW